MADICKLKQLGPPLIDLGYCTIKAFVSLDPTSNLDLQTESGTLLS